ncbi:MAG: LLM class flavin-dependent oxidoreductase [Pseudomonadales bacterium]|nr:LLM class flavin-dependent oxidoreductase [Pseudomonadales bacterium]
MLAGEFEARKALVDEIVASGVNHLFLADHVSFKTGMGMDAIVNAATLLAMNPRLHVCIGVYLLALRHPLPVARQLATLNESAPGRLIFGVGVGGEDRHEFEICGVDPATRGKRTNHSLAALRSLMTGEKTSYRCEFFEFEDALIRPRVDPPIPFMVGGRSDAAIRRAAKYSEGWLAVWCSPRRFREATAQVEEIALASGRVDVPWRHGLQVWVGIDNDRDKAREILAREMYAFYRTPFEAFEKYSPYGTPEDVAEFLSTYVEAGAGLLNVKACASSDQAAALGVAEVARLLRR